MAIVTAPLMSAEARGRVGGLVANTWRGLSTFKSKTAPAQPRSQAQLNLRNLGIKVTRAWQGLTALQRSNWDDYATAHPETNWTGNTKRLTGANWFQRCNTRLAFYLGTAIADAPTDPAPDPVTGFSIADGVGDIIVTWTDTALLNGKVIIWLSGPHSAGQQARLPRARFNHLASMAAATYTIPGVPAGTYDVWVTSFDPATGLVSTLQLDSVAVT